MEGEGVGLLGRGGDGEGMPLKLSNGGNVEVDIVAGLEGEVGRPLDDKVDNPGGEDDPGGDVALALVGERVVEAEQLLADKDGKGADNPLPEVDGVEDEEQPEDQVEEVGPVEDLHNTTNQDWPA